VRRCQLGYWAIFIPLRPENPAVFRWDEWPVDLSISKLEGMKQETHPSSAGGFEALLVQWLLIGHLSSF